MSRQGDAELRGREARAALGCRTRNLLSPPQPGGWRAWGGGGRAGGGGPWGAAAAPGCSTQALRQAAARAHLPAAAPGCVIGCPRRAREIELSIHSWAGRARTVVAELSPRALGDARCLPPTRRRVLARDVGAHGRRRRGLFLWRLRVSGPVIWVPPRVARDPGGVSAGGPRDAPCGKRERNCEKVPGRFFLN